MPDDRELLSTRRVLAAAGRPLPGQAAEDQLVVSRQTETLASDDILLRKPLGFLFWLAIGWVSLVVLAAILANVLPLQNPDFQNYTALNQGPSLHHLLGTDDLGRDLLARLVFGARVSLVVGFVSVAIGMLVGGTAGLISGYKGGNLDVGLNAVAFVILAFPPSWRSSPSWPSGGSPCSRSPSSWAWAPSP